MEKLFSDLLTQLAEDHCADACPLIDQMIENTEISPSFSQWALSNGELEDYLLCYQTISEGLEDLEYYAVFPSEEDEKALKDILEGWRGDFVTGYLAYVKDCKQSGKLYQSTKSAWQSLKEYQTVRNKYL